MNPTPSRLAPRPPKLLLEERRREIVKWVERQGRATVEELSQHFEISAVTIRADLEALARRDMLTRSHGGALPAPRHQLDTPLSVKETRRLAQKRRIGLKAATLIKDGETIIIDSGSTTVEIARQIRQQSWTALTVITNALNIATELTAVSGVRIMMLGGLLRPTSGSMAGPDAEQALARLSADKAFLGVDGLDPQIGITTPDPAEASLNALMIKVARQSIAVADASKFDQRCLSVIAPIEALDLIISDTGARPDCIEALHAHGVRTLLV
ncbi:DeoR/GlpR family DNA-binding transcription regulator [Frateuria aurantia]